MKRGHTYEIRHMDNTVTITKRFLEAASQMDTKECQLFRQFQEMGFSIIVEKRTARAKNDNPLRNLKSAEERKPLIPFGKMAHYISLLDDADVMMDEFDAVREAAKGQQHPRKYVNDWFRREFPKYEEIPELDEDNRIVHNPNAA